MVPLYVMNAPRPARWLAFLAVMALCSCRGQSGEASVNGGSERAGPKPGPSAEVLRPKPDPGVAASNSAGEGASPKARDGEQAGAGGGAVGYLLRAFPAHEHTRTRCHSARPSLWPRKRDETSRHDDHRRGQRHAPGAPLRGEARRMLSALRSGLPASDRSGDRGARSEGDSGRQRSQQRPLAIL